MIAINFFSLISLHCVADAATFDSYAMSRDVLDFQVISVTHSTPDGKASMKELNENQTSQKSAAHKFSGWGANIGDSDNFVHFF